MYIRPTPLRESVRVGLLFCSSMVLLPYQKSYLPVSEQVELLRGRGMLISDTARAAVCLRRIGYYRLSGYAYPFRRREIVREPDGSEKERVFEQFRHGTEFSTIMDLYIFDKKLRMLMLDAIERIEVALRVEVALVLGKHGATSYREIARFNRFFRTPDEDTGISPHKKLLTKLDEAFDRSNEDFAIHYRGKYSSPLPIWMSIELWDFGTLASILSGMQDPDLDKVAAAFLLPKRRYLVSWAQSINFVRNICAHHGRLWNRGLIQQPAPPRPAEVADLGHLAADEFGKRRLYAVAACMQFLMRTVHPGSTWSERLKRHLEKFPSSPQVLVRHMGFPERWQELPLWGAPQQNA